MIYRIGELMGELFCGPGDLAWGAMNADIDDKDTRIIHAWTNAVLIFLWKVH